MTHPKHTLNNPYICHHTPSTQFSPRIKWAHLLHAKMSQIGTCLYARLVFHIDFLDIDGLINLEVGNKNVQRFETERLRHTRALRESTS